MILLLTFFLGGSAILKSAWWPWRRGGGNWSEPEPQSRR